MELLNKGRFFEIIVYNLWNQIAADQWNAWTFTGGGGFSTIIV